MLSKADCSFLAKTSIGTLRDTGKTATVLRLVLLCPSSDPGFLVCPRDELSTSSLTLEAIMRNNLFDTSSYTTRMIRGKLLTVQLFEGSL